VISVLLSSDEMNDRVLDQERHLVNYSKRIEVIATEWEIESSHLERVSSLMTRYLTNRSDRGQMGNHEEEYLNILTDISTILQNQAHSIVGSFSQQVIFNFYTQLIFSL
jgi:hypothetical protein